MKGFFSLSTIIAVILVLAACTPARPDADIDISSHLQVVATTSIVADVVTRVGGERIRVSTLLPVGADPHGFDPSPQDIASVAQARVIFANGAGLEEFLERLIASAQAEDRVVALSEDVLLLESEDPHKEPEDENESEEHHGGDPHTWTDPNNVLLWVDAVELALVKVDPTNANLFRENANTYREELRQLDSWVREQVAHIPPEDRLLVTDHTLFTYFAHTYGFTQVGAVVESYSTLAEPSAQELAVLEDSIRALGVKAVFVGSTVNPGLASRVSRDTGVRLVPIYTGSLSESDGEAATYLDYIRYNTLAIVEALK